MFSFCGLPNLATIFITNIFYFTYSEFKEGWGQVRRAVHARPPIVGCGLCKGEVRGNVGRARRAMRARLPVVGHGLRGRRRGTHETGSACSTAHCGVWFTQGRGRRQRGMHKMGGACSTACCGAWFTRGGRRCKAARRAVLSGACFV